jgi:anhydro-N-acetylmuramic acid kinase
MARARAEGLNDADVLATASELTAAGIARACARFLPAWPARLYVGGGGTANTAVMAALRAALEREAGEAAPDIRSVAEAGLPPEAKEAICFAVLGHETLHGRPNVMPRSTGAHHPTVLGAIWPGENYGDLIARVATSGAPDRPVDGIAARVVRGAGMGGTT